MRLIDADTLKDEVMKIWAYIQCVTGDDVMDAVMTDIKNAPTVDAEPLRHGEWNGWTATHWTGKKDDDGDPIYAEHIYYKCSECGRRTVIREKFCPNCGAKMDVERREE